jgi:hypothetical protein
VGSPRWHQNGEKRFAEFDEHALREGGHAARVSWCSENAITELDRSAVIRRSGITSPRE